MAHDAGIPVVTVDCLPHEPLLGHASALVVSGSYLRAKFPDRPMEGVFQEYLQATGGLVIFTLGENGGWYGRPGTERRTFGGAILYEIQRLTYNTRGVPSKFNGLLRIGKEVRGGAVSCQLLVVHVGALVDAHKGQRQIIAVAHELARSAPDVAFLLVGSGRDEAVLRAEAADLSNLSFAGQVVDVGNYLAAADLFLYPSRHEGLGSVVLDAMAFGLPGVATNVGGIPEVVQRGVNGLLCDPDDTAGLAAAILTLRADADLRARMAAANRARAAEFSPSAMMKRYTEVYRDLLPGGTGKAAST